MKKLTKLLIPLALLIGAWIPAMAEEEFEPDFESVCFVPKGQWITGVSVSYSQSNQNNYQFLVLENVSGDTYSLKVSPMLMFAFKNDLAAGANSATTAVSPSLRRPT